MPPVALCPGAMARAGSVRGGASGRRDAAAQTGRTYVRRRQRRAVAGIVGSLAAYLALPLPSGQQCGGLSVVWDVMEYIYFAAHAQELGYTGYGDTTVAVGVPPGSLPTKYSATAIASALVGAPPRPYDPSAGAVFNYSRGFVELAQGVGLDLGSVRAGKLSLYGPSPRDPSTWHSQCLVRFSNHRLAAEGYKIAAVVGIFEDEQAALDSERHLAEKLGPATGLASLNSVPYSPGKLSTGKGSAFANYIQVR